MLHPLRLIYAFGVLFLPLNKQKSLNKESLNKESLNKGSLNKESLNKKTPEIAHHSSENMTPHSVADIFASSYLLGYCSLEDWVKAQSLKIVIPSK